MTELQELRDRLQQAQYAQFFANISDNFYHTSWRKDEDDRHIKNLEKKIEELENGCTG